MKGGWIWVLLAAIAILGVPGTSQYLQESAPGEVIVGLERGAVAAASQVMSSSLQTFGGEIIDTIPELGAVRIRLPEGQEQSFAMSTARISGVDYAEPNYLLEAHDPPNDPKWGQQWGPRKIHVPEAWEITQGDREVLVAVVDSGLDYTHPDLADAYVDAGYDFVDDDDDPFPIWETHGTHVAGIIAAVIGNRVGIAGIADVSIMAVRVLGPKGRGTVWNVAHGIVYAVKKHARVINLSLGGSRKSELLEAAVQFALSAGCVVVASAGNRGGPSVSYPAAYPGVIAVSAIDEDGELADFSSYGPEVDVAAPGVDILSTVIAGKYEEFSGTSMAAPHVAGVVALMLSVNPNLTPEQIRDILHETAKDLGKPGKDDKYGYGLVDAYAAVQRAEETRDGGATPPEPVPRQLSVSTDKTTYRLGELVNVSYTVPERGRVTIYRVGPSSMPEEVSSRTVQPGTYELPNAWRASKTGVETVVIRVQTTAGRFQTTAHTYTIGSPSAVARLWMDKACGSTYRIGERCHIYVEVSETCTVRLFDFSSDGNVVKLLEQRLDAGQRHALAARVTGPAGTELLVLQAVTPDGVVTAYCRFEITR